METITINGKEYIEKTKDFVTPEYNGEYKIVILQRGWVMIGKFERNANECKLHNASVIRTWGTTKGLGEIAKNGPTKNTILDKCYGLVEFDYLTVVATVSVEESVWQKEL